jgi:hypothetical protein
MSTGSFAEILREKLEKTDGNRYFSSVDDDITSINTPTKESIELNQLRQKLFEQHPHSFSMPKAKMSETPYRQFQNQKKYMPSDTYDWANKVHSKVNFAATTTHTPPVTRPKGVAHKLNEKQTLAMSYFINEHQFLLEDFTADELKKAFRKLALVKHPDRKSGSQQNFLELNRSYESLASVFKK